MSFWRRDPLPLGADTPDGTRVFVEGIARSLPDDEPFVPPVRGVPCVVAHVVYKIWQAKDRRPTKFDRLVNRPFGVSGDVDVIVDALQLDLDDVPEVGEGTVVERSVPVGARVRVVGEVLRDAALQPGEALRDAPAVIKLIGSKRAPVEVTLL